MHDKVAWPDRAIAELATRQHGIVAVRQLALAGIDRHAVDRRCRAGRLHRLHRGVYAVGHRGLSQEGCWMAAILACGRGAALSHRSAAALWGLLPVAAGAIEIAIPGLGGRAKRRGIRIHRSATLTAEQIAYHKGIAVTNPARTIADLGRTASAPVLRRAIREADVLGLDLPAQLKPDQTRSELEHRFLGLCRRQRLPQPEVNARVGGLRVDFLWRRQRLIVETDGYRFHRGRQAFEDDRARDLELRLHGYDVLRFSYHQVSGESQRIAQAIRERLVARGG